MIQENELELLLDLDGVIIEQVGRYWTKFEVKRTSITKERPHGIRYSLTLHDNFGNRTIGFDNAHSVKLNGKYAGPQYDHFHRHFTDPGFPYRFINAHKLLEDF